MSDNIKENKTVEVFVMAFCEKCGKEISEGSVCAECASKTNSEKSFFQTILDTKDTTAEYSKEEIEKNKVVCGLAYIPILFWLPLVAGTKGSKYCKFHSNNGLLLLILDIVIGIVSAVLGLIPFVIVSVKSDSLSGEIKDKIALDMARIKDIIKINFQGFKFSRSLFIEPIKSFDFSICFPGLIGLGIL